MKPNISTYNIAGLLIKIRTTNFVSFQNIFIVCVTKTMVFLFIFYKLIHRLYLIRLVGKYSSHKIIDLYVQNQFAIMINA